MAQSYSCDLCGQVMADYMITRIQDGQSIAVGVECLLDFAMPIAAAYAETLDADPEAPDSPPGAPEAGTEPWEDGYPQGRPDGPEGPPEGPEGQGSDDQTAGAAADVPG